MKVRSGPAGVPHVVPQLNAHVEAYKHFANTLTHAQKNQEKVEVLRILTSAALKIKALASKEKSYMEIQSFQLFRGKTNHTSPVCTWCALYCMCIYVHTCTV